MTTGRVEGGVCGEMWHWEKASERKMCSGKERRERMRKKDNSERVTCCSEGNSTLCRTNPTFVYPGGDRL